MTILAVSIRYGYSNSRNSFTLVGELTVEESSNLIPSGSCLTVTLGDVSMVDISERIIAKSVTLITKTTMQGHKYKLEVVKRAIGEIKNGDIFSISSVLNMGWCPDKKSSDWFREGDYVTDTANHFDLIQCQSKICYGPSIVLKKG